MGEGRWEKTQSMRRCTSNPRMRGGEQSGAKSGTETFEQEGPPYIQTEVGGLGKFAGP